MLIKLTRRQAAMLLIAAAWLSRGIVYAIEGHRTIIAQDEQLLFTLWPDWVTAATWTGGALIATVVVLSRRPRWEHVGWAALTIAPSLRAASYLWSFLMWAIPGLPHGSRESIWWGIYWAAQVAIVSMIASWPKCPEMVEDEVEVRE